MPTSERTIANSLIKDAFKQHMHVHTCLRTRIFVEENNKSLIHRQYLEGYWHAKLDFNVFVLVYLTCRKRYKSVKWAAILRT